jgi:hypothetical protein
MPTYEGGQSRPVMTAEIVLQQLPIGQSSPVPQKDRGVQVLDDIAHRAVRHVASLIGVSLTLYLTITRTRPFDAHIWLTVDGFG